MSLLELVYSHRINETKSRILQEKLDANETLREFVKIGEELESHSAEWQVTVISLFPLFC